MTDQFQDRFSMKATTVPALGLSWSSSVDMRIMLTKTKRLYQGDQQEPQIDFDEEEEILSIKKRRKLNGDGVPIREMKIIFSPYLPNSSCFYVIDWAGLKGIDY